MRWGQSGMIVCGPKLKPPPKCWVSHCPKPSIAECDWPVADGKTCDRPVCGDHADQFGPNQHWCPAHSIENAKTKLRTGN
jgi:hypothetical protein